MNKYRYILEPYKGPTSRHRCPQCNQPRKFTLYIDTVNGRHLADYVGRCDRESKCGYHYKPGQYFNESSISRSQSRPLSFRSPTIKPVPRSVNYLPIELVAASHQNMQQNNLWQFFTGRIGEAAATVLFEKYKVGTSKLWPGATAFWQIDNKMNARQCKVMLFDPDTGKRVKRDGQSFISFMGKRILENDDANLQQCFFGCHLLSRFPSSTVAIVESEKTAMYCAHYYPDNIWMATGGKHGCKILDRATLEPLKGRSIVLFPDLMATADWQAKAERIKTMISCKIHVSTKLETMASNEDKAAGLDIMDYLLQQNTGRQENFSDPLPITEGLVIGPYGYPASWDESAPKISQVVNIKTETNIVHKKQVIEPLEPLNEIDILQKYIDEALQGFRKSMVKNFAHFYPMFIQSNYPFIRRDGIDPETLRAALSLCKQQKFSKHANS